MRVKNQIFKIGSLQLSKARNTLQVKYGFTAIFARLPYASACKKLKLLACGGIFLATQLPFMDLIFPKRLANTLLLKIFRLGNFRM